jgi:hypothetical protein
MLCANQPLDSYYGIDTVPKPLNAAGPAHTRCSQLVSLPNAAASRRVILWTAPRMRPEGRDRAPGRTRQAGKRGHDWVVAPCSPLTTVAGMVLPSLAVAHAHATAIAADCVASCRCRRIPFPPATPSCSPVPTLWTLPLNTALSSSAPFDVPLNCTHPEAMQGRV